MLEKKVQRKKLKHHVYLNLAREISRLATCDRAHVGAVIVKNDRVVSQGYNGAPAGADHCDEVGHLLSDGHCLRTCHAEENAIIWAADRDDLKNAVMYVTHQPCIDCIKMACQVDMREIRYNKPYEHELEEEAEEIARQSGLALIEQEDGIV